MDLNVVNGILRAVLPGILGYLAGKGLISQGSIPDIVAAVVTLAAAAWSVASNVPKKDDPPVKGN